MPKSKASKGTKITLKMAKNAIRTTIEGRRRLTLTNMGIVVFPKCLFKLSNIDEVDLSRNQIKSLPNDIGNFQSLTLLDLHSNKLESVPETIGNLKNLMYLNLSNNQITSAGLPTTLGSLTNLKFLNVGMNKLDALPPSMETLENLEELGLFDNHFRALPEFVNTLPSLTKLNVRRNPLWYSQGDVKDLTVKKTERDKGVYLVHEKNLCKTCLKRCKDHQHKTLRTVKGADSKTKAEEEGGANLTVKCVTKYMGLIAPNSVAKSTQQWRLKKIFK